MMLAVLELVFASVHAAQAGVMLFADRTHSLDGGDILPYERTRADAVTTPVGDFSARYASNSNSVSALLDAMQAYPPKILAMYIASSDASAVRLTRTTGWLGAVSFVEESVLLLLCKSAVSQEFQVYPRPSGALSPVP